MHMIYTHLSLWTYQSIYHSTSPRRHLSRQHLFLKTPSDDELYIQIIIRLAVVLTAIPFDLAFPPTIASQILPNEMVEYLRNGKKSPLKAISLDCPKIKGIQHICYLCHLCSLKAEISHRFEFD